MGDYVETLQREQEAQRRTADLEAQLAAAKRLLDTVESANATLTGEVERLRDVISKREQDDAVNAAEVERIAADVTTEAKAELARQEQQEVRIATLTAACEAALGFLDDDSPSLARADALAAQLRAALGKEGDNGPTS